MPHVSTAKDPSLDSFSLGAGVHRVVLVHGFTGSPLETRSFGEALAQKGLLVQGVRLAGHGVNPHELEGARAEEWMDDVRTALHAGPGRASLVGLSMGAMLAAIAAARYPERVERLVLLAPALRLHGMARLFVELARLSPFPMMPRFIAKGGSDIADEVMRKRHRTFVRVPLSSGNQFRRVAAWGRQALPKIVAPTLVVGAPHDHTVPYTATLDVFAALRCAERRFVTLDRSFHLMTLDLDRAEVLQATLAWLKPRA